jgi:hypothetical protein
MACPVHMSRRARRLQLSVRSYDMVGRYGGGEFLVALNRCDPGSAISLAENLRTVIGGRPISVGNQKVTVTISIGLALSTDFGNCGVDEILHEADRALYAAKAGKELRAGSGAGWRQTPKRTKNARTVDVAELTPEENLRPTSLCRAKRPSSAAWPPRSLGRGVRATLPAACMSLRSPQKESDS